MISRNWLRRNGNKKCYRNARDGPYYKEGLDVSCLVSGIYLQCLLDPQKSGYHWNYQDDSAHQRALPLKSKVKKFNFLRMSASIHLVKVGPCAQTKILFSFIHTTLTISATPLRPTQKCSSDESVYTDTLRKVSPWNISPV